MRAGDETVPEESGSTGHQAEPIESRTFQHLSSNILASNSQLKCGTPLILAQITHKGPIVDICYVSVRATEPFEYTYLRLETPLFLLIGPRVRTLITLFV